MTESGTNLARRGIDARGPLLFWVAYCVVLASVDKHDAVRMVVFAAIPLFAATFHGIPWRRFLARLRVLSPFLVFMAIVHPWFDRRIALQLWGLDVSYGSIATVVLLSKSVLSILAIHVLTHRFPIDTIFSSFARIGVPPVFVTQLSLLHRYGFLVVSEAESMRRARDLRSRDRRGRGWIDTARLIGTLFLRSSEHAQRIHRSMLARGFTGIMPTGARQEWTMVGKLRIVGAVLCLIVARTSP